MQTCQRAQLEEQRRRESAGPQRGPFHGAAFPVVPKFPTKATLGRSGLLRLAIRGDTVQPWTGGQLVTLQSVRKPRARDAGPGFLRLIQCRTPVRGVVPPTFMLDDRPP